MDELDRVFENTKYTYQDKMAQTLDKAIVDVKETSASYIETIGLGLERGVMHLSMFFDGYEDVHEKTKEEDKRFFKMIYESATGENPVKEIVKLFFNYLIEDLDDNEIKYLNYALKTTLHSAGKMVTQGGTRVYIATIVSELFYSAVLRNAIAKKMISKGSNLAMFVSAGYGVIELAARAKERLRYENPIFFNILYIKGIEMAYFIVEPNLSSELHMISGKKMNVDDIVKSINKIIYS